MGKEKYGGRDRTNRRRERRKEGRRKRGKSAGKAREKGGIILDKDLRENVLAAREFARVVVKLEERGKENYKSRLRLCICG